MLHASAVYSRVGALAFASVLDAMPLAAQERLVERRTFAEGQGKLIGYYSAALTFSPAEAPLVERAGTVRAAVEVSYIPALSEDRRRVGDKPEASNLAPVIPRPRASLALPGAVRLEASWIPPVKLFGVKANVVSAALSRTFGGAAGALSLTPRVAGTIGRVEGAITCYEDLSAGDAALREYFDFVCHGRESEDHFSPRHVTGEMIVARTPPASARGLGALTPYAGAGVRLDRTRFDIGVITDNGARDADQPILDLHATRPYLFAGASWLAARRLRTGAELFYAPGSLVTVRLSGSIRVRGG